MSEENVSKDYITYICDLYGDAYDDRLEDCRPPAAGSKVREPGEDWVPGQVADHKSLCAFQKELKELGIALSTSKIKKILITGGCWTTKRSREVAELFKDYTSSAEEGGKGLTGDMAVKEIASVLQISVVTVSVNLPYQNVVYKMEKRSSNAKRCARYKERKKMRMGEGIF